MFKQVDKFAPAFRVQLTPTNIPCHQDFLVQAAPHGGWFVRMRGRALTVADLTHALDTTEALAKGAVYAAIPDDLCRPEYVAVLRARGYAFWNYSEEREFIYYRWMPKDKYTFSNTTYLSTIHLIVHGDFTLSQARHGALVCD